MRGIFFGIVIFYSALAAAQSDSLVYYNHYWKQTTKDSAAFYRVVARQGSLFAVKDYYFSGELQMQGSYSSLTPEIQEGYFIWYYDNGRKFVEGNYVHGQREGIWTFWYPDGLKKQEIRFLPGKPDEFVFRWRSYREKNSLHLVETASRKAHKGKVQKAEALLHTAIANNPFCAEAYYERGLLRCATSRLPSGCDDLEKARAFGFYDTGAVNNAIGECCGEKRQLLLKH